MPLRSERVIVVFKRIVLTGTEITHWTDLRGEIVLLSHYDPGRVFEDLLVSKIVLPEDRPKVAHRGVSRGIIKSLIDMRAGIRLVLESDIGASFAELVYLRDGTGPAG